MTRRPKGSGTIEKTRDGRHRARFAFDGKHREDIDGSPFATRPDAARALDVLLAQLAAAPVAGISLRKLAERALDHRERDGFRAIDSDRSVWRAYFEPWDLASEPAKTITRGDVRERLAAIRSRAGKPLAGQTRRNARNVLAAIFAFGVDAELLEENPCHGLRVKDRGTSRETSTHLSRSEADALLAAAARTGLLEHTAVAVALGTGVRSGELRSLRWEDVHLDGASPEIVIRFGAPEKPTKNGKIRHVPLFGVALDALRAAHARKDGALVLPRPAVERKTRSKAPPGAARYRAKGRVVEPASWRAWKLAAGITRPVRWHDLRHTAATLLLTGGWGTAPWSYEAVKDMLGHSSVKVTERYARSGSLASSAVAAMTPPPKKPRAHKPKTSPQPDAEIVTQARDIIERCRWDLNPHMPVLQTVLEPSDPASLGHVAGLVRAYVAAVAVGDPFAHRHGLDLAAAVLELGRHVATPARAG
jgi:integrase